MKIGRVNLVNMVNMVSYINITAKTKVAAKSKPRGAYVEPRGAVADVSGGTVLEPPEKTTPKATGGDAQRTRFGKGTELRTTPKTGRFFRRAGP